jgi:predicted PurR-regulated permease PerM
MSQPRRLKVEIDARIFVAVVSGVLLLSSVIAMARASHAGLLQVGTGLLLAFALDPLVTRLHARIGGRRSLSVLAIALSMVAVAAIFIFVLGPPALDQGRRFSSELPNTLRDMYRWPLVGNLLEHAQAADRVSQWIHELPSHIDPNTVTNLASSLLTGVVSTTIIILIAFGVLLDGPIMLRRIRRLLPVTAREDADRVGRIFYRTVAAYFAGSLLVAMLSGTFILTAGLMLRIPLAPAAALWMVLVDLIPQVGGFLGGFVFTVLGFAVSPLTGIVALGLYLIWMEIENHVIQPAVVGEAVNLSPPTTMLAALVGGAVAGVPGAIVATPVCGVVKKLYLELRYGPQPEPSVRRRLMPAWLTKR